MIARVRALPPTWRALWVLAVVQGLTVLASCWVLVPRYAAIAALPVDDPWFPAALSSSVTVLVPQLVLMMLGGLVVVRPIALYLRLYAWTLLGVGAVLLVHQASFGWAGGVLLFWSGVWAVWLAYARVGVQRGPFFALLLLGGLFAYPALGKLSPGFLSGQVYWDLMWSHREGVHAWLGPALGEEGHRSLAAVYGPFTIVSEGVLALVWLLPARIGFGLALLTFAGILVTGGLQFVDAMGLLAALVASGWVLAEDPRTEARQSSAAA